MNSDGTDARVVTDSVALRRCAGAGRLMGNRSRRGRRMNGAPHLVRIALDGRPCR